MKRTSSGTLRQEALWPVTHRPGTKLLGDSGVDQIPAGALEHIRYLSQFSPIQVYQWIEVWKSSEREHEENFNLDSNYALELTTDVKTEHGARDLEVDERVKSRVNQQPTPNIYKRGRISRLEVSSPKDSEKQATPEKSGAPTKSRTSHKDRPEIYACLFCQKTFNRKGDWKRHEGTLHEPQREWRCPGSGCNRKFFARNKFRRHHESDHGCIDCRHDSDPAVMIVLRSASAWGCGFCITVLMTWDERVDHIGGHFEAGCKRREWDFSTVVRSLLLQPGICDAWLSLLHQIHGPSTANWPLFEWRLDSCFDLLRMLKASKSSDATRDVAGVVQSAYKLGSSSSSHPQLYISPPISTTSPGTYLQNLSNHEFPLDVASGKVEAGKTAQTLQTSPMESIGLQTYSQLSQVPTADTQTSDQDHVSEEYDFDGCFGGVGAKNYTRPCLEIFQPTSWGMWPEPLDSFML